MYLKSHTRNSSWKNMWKFWCKIYLILLRNLNLRIYTVIEFFFNLTEWLQVTEAGSLQTLNLTNSKQEQLLNEFWDCWLSCCAKVLKERRYILWVVLSRYLQWHIQIICRELSQHLYDALSNCCCLLLVSINILGTPRC